jgi:hypothetical protein
MLIYKMSKPSLTCHRKGLASCVILLETKAVILYLAYVALVLMCVFLA